MRKMTVTPELVQKICQVLGGEHNRTRVSEALGLNESEDDARLAEISRITSVAEAWQAYNNAPSGKSQKAALAKWNKLSLAEVSAAKTVDQARRAYDNAPSGKSRKAALAKWGELSLAEVSAAKTVDQARQAYDNAPSGSKSRKAALAKWDELSLAEVSAAKTVDQARQAYYNAPSGKSEKAAIWKIAELLAARLLSEGGQAEDSSGSAASGK